MEKPDPCYTAGGSAKRSGTYGQQAGSSLDGETIELSYNPAIPLLNIYTREMTTQCPHKNLYMNAYGSQNVERTQRLTK